jgi:cephalosporin-C deacetylase-like acetyl esterase
MALQSPRNLRRLPPRPKRVENLTGFGAQPRRLDMIGISRFGRHLEVVEQLEVEFGAEGNVTIRGLFVPDVPGPRPAITMAHGYAGIRESLIALINSDGVQP